MKKQFLLRPFLLGLLVVLVVGGLLVGLGAKNSPRAISVVPTPTITVASIQYAGKEGLDALTLLKQHAAVHESSPGFVDEINGERAESSKHEYWAFYVNGKLANVGAGQYITHDSDKISWEIEAY